MLKTTKLMHALWSSRNRVWGVWARSAFVLCEKSWMKRQIGGTTCAINYYLSIVSSILSGVWGICIIFELPEVQLIHQLVRPDDCNSCSFFGNLFVAKHANLSEMKGEITGLPSFWLVKIPATFPVVLSLWIPRKFFHSAHGVEKNSPGAIPFCFTVCGATRQSCWAVVPRFSCFLGRQLKMGSGRTTLGHEIWKNPRHFCGG